MHKRKPSTAHSALRRVAVSTPHAFPRTPAALHLLAALVLAASMATSSAVAGESSEVLKTLEIVQGAVTRHKMATLAVNFIKLPEGGTVVDLSVLAGDHADYVALITEMETALKLAVRHVKVNDNFKDITLHLTYTAAAPTKAPARELHGSLADLYGRILWRKQLHEERQVDRFVAKYLLLKDDGDLQLEGFVTALPALTKLVEGLEASRLYDRIDPEGLRTRRSGDLLIQETGIVAHLKP